MGRTFIIFFKIYILIFQKLYFCKVPPIPPKCTNSRHLNLFGSFPDPPVPSWTNWYGPIELVGI
jgi:hypothetical protein